MKKYLLEIVVFICGADLMILEMVGSRVLAPYLGTSIYVWTSLIGVILGCLSLGYWTGGKLADKQANPRTLSSIIFLSAISITLVSFFKEYLITHIQNIIINDPRVITTVAALILFGPPSALLGIVSPYAAKLRINSLSSSGSTVGTLYAISTIGSIVGTFLAGFFLIAFLGNTRILIVLAISLAGASFLLYSKDKALKIIALLIFIVYLGISTQTNKMVNNSYYANLIDVDSNYNRIWIYEWTHPKTKRPYRVMQINNEQSSSIFLDSSETVGGYFKFFRLAKHFNPGFKNALMIGGAAYVYPMDFLAEFKNATMDVVEIDPQVTDLAKKYFRLVDSPRLNIYHEDGRTFLNRIQKKYDAIFLDVFKSSTIPHHLTTRETVQKIYESLSEGGVVLANIISAIDGMNGRFLKAEVATYESVFPQVFLFPVANPQQTQLVQNIMLVALKSPQKPSFQSDDREMNTYLKNYVNREIEKDLPLLTDEYAPVERYQSYELKDLHAILFNKIFSKLKHLLPNKL